MDKDRLVISHYALSPSAIKWDTMFYSQHSLALTCGVLVQVLYEDRLLNLPQASGEDAVTTSSHRGHLKHRKVENPENTSQGGSKLLTSPHTALVACLSHSWL